ncbi:magnesium transporter NIPA-domain-containing protein [Scleroderma yunnanense]
MMLIDDPSIHLPHLTLQTLIGISISITGNILISLALNLQKLAHQRLDREHKKVKSEREREAGIPPRNGRCDPRPTHDPGAAQNGGGIHQVAPEILPLESQPLLHPRSSSVPPPSSYGSRNSDISLAGDDTRSGASTHTGRSRRRQRRPTFTSRLMPLRLNFGISPSDPVRQNSFIMDDGVVPVDVTPKQQEQNGCHKHKKTYHPVGEDTNEGDYLRSKLWWLGFILMNVGESGNFISYAFAPASIVAPLGTFALVANCFFAPLMLNEHFRSRDLLGILLAVIGASTVVLSSPSSDGVPPLTPDALLEAITQRSFVIFSIVYAALAIVLGGLSEGHIGRQVVVVDVGLCAVFGGFTVLATKATSTLLTKEWGKMFTEWITYPVFVVLLLTGVLQIRYLNRALKRFDSKIVIPTQFVLFTLSAVVGSAVLYGDFRRATFHQMVTFLYGCAATFVGVYVIAWGPNRSNVETGEDVERGDDGPRSVPGTRSDGSAAVGSVRSRTSVTVVPKASREVPVLRNRASTLSMVGYSPVQQVLVHTPPRERVEGGSSESVSGNSRRSR